jgi:hypothetical protein
MSDNCYKPNIYNPMGNFLPFDDRNRSAVCNISMNEHYNYLMQKNETFDSTFRLNFNPNAVTTSYPDITGFAKYLFKDPARCRDTGYLCRTDADQTKNVDRMGFNPNDKYYQEINYNSKGNKFNIGGHTN